MLSKGKEWLVISRAVTAGLRWTGLLLTLLGSEFPHDEAKSLYLQLVCIALKLVSLRLNHSEEFQNLFKGNLYRLKSQIVVEFKLNLLEKFADIVIAKYVVYVVC